VRDPLADYTTVLDGFERVLREVPADGWEGASPCEGWAARDVAGHVIGGVHMLGMLATGTTPPAERPSDREMAGDDPVASWRAARAATTAALTPEALERVVPGPVGDLPLMILIEQFMTGEMLVHTWDLARAAGVDVELDPALVEDTFARWEPIDSAGMRSPGVFGPALPAPEGASRQDQLMAFLGRRV
jgi:uncharacterized protein (TIGR03086 family)